jgi:anti-sigma28 factor (negative regulator of flagellin synthesis)
MIMEIQRITDAYQMAVYGPSSTKVKKTEQVSKGQEAARENVELSSSSQTLQKVKEAVLATQDVRLSHLA